MLKPCVCSLADERLCVGFISMLPSTHPRNLLEIPEMPPAATEMTPRLVRLCGPKLRHLRWLQDPGMEIVLRRAARGSLYPKVAFPQS